MMRPPGDRMRPCSGRRASAARRGSPAVLQAWLLAAAAALHPGAASAQTAPTGPLPLLLSTEFWDAAVEKPAVVFPVPAPPPRVDGDLLDQAWQGGLWVDLQSDMPGGAVSRQTRVKTSRDMDTLYVAFECRAPDVDSYPILKDPPRDAPAAENFGVYLAPPGAGNEVFEFMVDVVGGRTDASLSRGRAWNAEWQAVVQRSLDLWRGEIAIPYRALGVSRPEAAAPWRINFARRIGATQERCSWQPTRGQPWNALPYGLLFFGTIDEFEKRTVPSAVHLYPLRRTLGAEDYGLRLAVRLDAPAAVLAKSRLALRVALETLPEGQTGAPPPTEAVMTPKGNRASFLLNAKAIPSGSFALSADLLDEKDGRIASGRIVLSKAMPFPEAAPASAEASAEAPVAPAPPSPPYRVPLILPSYPVRGTAVRNWPISAGVALPPGKVFWPKNVRLLAPNGQEVPAQAQARARWPSDGSIRWLGVDFQGDLSRAGGTTYAVECGPAVQPAPVTGFKRDQKWKHLPFEPVEQEWLVNTGPLLFSINTRQFSGIGEAWVDVDGNGFYDWNEQIINAGVRDTGDLPRAGPYIVDANGWTYRFGADGDVRIELEEWNELRLVLRGEGRLTLDRTLKNRSKGEPRPPFGTDAGRCTIRIYAYAGQPFVRLQYRLDLSRAAANTPLANIAIMERIEFRRNYDAFVGTPEGWRRPIAEAGPVVLLKPGLGRSLILQPAAENPVALEGGGDVENWVCAAARDRGIAIALQDMGHLYPKAIELRPEGAAIIHLWPDHGPEAVRAARVAPDRRTAGGLGFAHSGLLMDLRVPPAYSTALHDAEKLADFDGAGDMARSDATGISVGCDLLYVFYSGNLDASRIRETVRAYEAVPHATQDYRSLAASGEFPELLPSARAERAGRLAALLLKAEQRFPEEGMFNFMDLHSRWLGEEGRWPLRQRWVGARRDVPAMLWMLSLQTGDPALRLAAARNLSHVLNLDVCRESHPDLASAADPRLRKVTGGFSDLRTPLHWQGGWHVGDRYARLRAPLLAYYLSGDLWSLDAIRLWSGAARQYAQANAGLDGAVFLDTLTHVLWMEYDPLLHSLQAECAEAVFRAPVCPDDIRDWSVALRSFARNTGDRRALDLLRSLKAPDADGGEEAPGALAFLSDLYAASGDPDVKARRDREIAAFEKAADALLASGRLPVGDEMTWEKLAAYVCAAGEPPEN